MYGMPTIKASEYVPNIVCKNSREPFKNGK